MKKTVLIICICFLAVFTSASVLPLAGMIFYRGDQSGAEQRDLAAFPALISDAGLNLDFGSQFEDWFRDHFAFRSELAGANSTAMLSIFNSSPEESVVAGKDGWLFYAETVPDYCREERLDEYELARLVRTVKLESDYAESRGAAYIFASAPNKNSIYPEMMGTFFSQNKGESLLDRLNGALAAEGVAVCNPKDDLTAAKSLGQLYYRCDSHWNLLGSTVVWTSLTKRITEETGVTFEPSSRTADTLASGEREDDLLKMVRPMASTMAEECALDSSPENYKVKGRMSGLDDAVIETTCEAAQLRLLMFRDSFGRAMIHPLANSFAETVFVRSTPFDLYGRLEGYTGGLRTVVVREIVERNLTKLLETAPVVPAPVIDENTLSGINNLKRYDEARINVEKGSKRGDLVMYCGTVPEAEGCYTRIFVKAGEKYYEAFPFCDSSSELCGKAGCGFTLWLPEDAEAVITEIVAGCGGDDLNL